MIDALALLALGAALLGGFRWAIRNDPAFNPNHPNTNHDNEEHSRS